MIYLALDTNIWLYLCNGFDPIAQNYQKALNTDSHFELLNTLKDKVNLKEITILVNDIIIDEWERNKNSASNLLTEVTKQKEILHKNLKSLKPYLNESSSNFILKEVGKEIVNQSELKIKRNKEHIQKVETFLRFYCRKILVCDQNYIDASKIAIQKKAPCHHNKNNTADTVILLSVIDFLHQQAVKETDHVIFISNNIAEFAQDQKAQKVQLHNDIVPLLKQKELTYLRHLGEAIELSEEITEDLELFNNYRELLYEDKKFGCLLPHCDEQNSFGYYLDSIKVFNYTDLSLAYNQITLFNFTEEERKNLTHVRQTEIGDCLACGISHARCPSCKETMCDPESDGFFHCNECESNFKVQHHHILKEDCLVEQQKEDYPYSYHM